MGSMTRGNIVTAGLQLAGNTGLTTLANTWLNAWLRSQYASFPWPFLLRRKSGISLAAGAASFSLGKGSNGVSTGIRRIVDPIWLYNSTKTERSKVRLQTVLETTEDDDLTVNDSTKHKGLPVTARAILDEATQDKWTVEFDKWADKDYLVKVAYYEQPDDISADATIPQYPNDRTMIQLVSSEALRYMNRRVEAREELEVLAAMVVDDRLKFGTAPGQNEEIGLDKSVFK